MHLACRRRVLGGWEISGTVISETGLPWFGNVAPSDSYGDTVGLGGDYSHPSEPHRQAAIHQGKGNGWRCLRLSIREQCRLLEACSRPGMAARTWASATCRQRCRGWRRPHQLQHSLYKIVCFRRKGSFRVPRRSFNTFNHTQFNGLQRPEPSTTRTNAAQFGFVNRPQDPRTFEFGGKIIF